MNDDDIDVSLSNREREREGVCCSSAVNIITRFWGIEISTLTVDNGG